MNAGKLVTVGWIIALLALGGVYGYSLPVVLVALVALIALLALVLS